MPPTDPRFILPEPPDTLKALSHELVGRLHDRWQSAGRLSFAEYMEAALYEPGLGYYSAGLNKFGAEGDFITAPELGRLFGRCLAQQVGDIAEHLRNAAPTAKGSGDAWDLLEIGAGSGRLAADLLQALSTDEGALPERYLILERSADLRAVQARTLREQAPDFADRVEWLDAPPANPWRGVVIANEVIDALAVERFRIAEDGVLQLGVRFDGDRPEWDAWPAPDHLASRVEAAQERLPAPLPVGYTSELCLQLPPWLDAVTNSLETGAALFIDYGYPRALFYHPERRDGTLVCHYRHRAHFDPFTWPGLQDLTAFVDFTAVAEAADAAGLSVAGYAPQNLFLFGCGLETLAGDLPDLAPQARQALAHELRELTLPGAMGEKFQVMALTRNLDMPLRGFHLGHWLDRL